MLRGLYIGDILSHLRLMGKTGSEISIWVRKIQNIPIHGAFASYLFSLLSILLLLLIINPMPVDNEFMSVSVYADPEEIHGDDDIMENRMIIPHQANGMMSQSDRESLPASPSQSLLPSPLFQTSATSAGDAGQLDRFGIKKIYSSKGNGERWFLGETGGLITGGVKLIKQSDGITYQVKSTQVRLRVPTSSGYHPDQITTYNQDKLQTKGYMQSPNDWKNVEITGLFNVKSYTDSTTNGAAHIELFNRGGTHTSSAPCEGTSYHGNLYVTGRSKFEKELEHTGGYATNNPQKTDAVPP